MALVLTSKSAPAESAGTVKTGSNEAFPKSPVEVSVPIIQPETDPNAAVSVGPDTTPANIFRGTRS